MSLLERLFAFHQSIQQGKFPNATSIAREFEVSLATAKRDIAYLRDRLLAPLVYDPQKFGYYYTEQGFSLPFTESPKLLLLLSVLNTLAQETGLAGLAEVRQLNDRLSSLLQADYQALSDSIYCEWIEVEAIDHTVFSVVLEGLAERKLLRIDYHSSRSQMSSRFVEPQRLCNYQGRWYLLAVCRLRGDLRLFHLARIQSAVAENGKIQRIANLSEDYLQSSFGIFKGKPIYTAEIRFSGIAAQLVRFQRWHSDQQSLEDGDGLILRLPVRDGRELIMKILQYGELAEVLNPPALREAVQNQVAKMMVLYEKGGVSAIKDTN